MTVPCISTEGGNSEARVSQKGFFLIKKLKSTHIHTTTLFRMQRIRPPNPALNDKKKLRNQDTIRLVWYLDQPKRKTYLAPQDIFPYCLFKNNKIKILFLMQAYQQIINWIGEGLRKSSGKLQRKLLGCCSFLSWGVPPGSRARATLCSGALPAERFPLLLFVLNELQSNNATLEIHWGSNKNL